MKFLLPHVTISLDDLSTVVRTLCSNALNLFTVAEGVAVRVSKPYNRTGSLGGEVNCPVAAVTSRQHC